MQQRENLPRDLTVGAESEPRGGGTSDGSTSDQGALDGAHSRLRLVPGTGGFGAAAAAAPLAGVHGAEPFARTAAEARLIYLDRTRAEEICALEPRCYSHPWSSDLIRSEFEKEISFRPALERGDRVIAYSFNYIVVDELHVLNLAVIPEERRNGIGRRLFAELLAGAFDRGARHATLEVRQSNHVAQRLYSSFGFELAGMRRHYYRDNSEHALVLERPLDEGFRHALPALALTRASAR